MPWFLARSSATGSSRWLEEYREASSAAADAFPPSTAFCAAAAIWIVILLSAMFLLTVAYIREQDLKTSLQALGRSVFVAPAPQAHNHHDYLENSRGGMSSSDAETERSLKQTEILSANYNLQTIFIALVQASIGMLLLGGLQLDFNLTCIIFFSLVIFWTFSAGVLMTMWVARVADRETTTQELHKESIVVLELKREMKTGTTLSFFKHFLEASIFQPMVHTREIVASDCYQDIGRDASRTLLLGVGQLILLSMYTWSIVDDGKPDFSNTRLYAYYCLGILMQIAYLSGQDMFYKSFSNHLSFWGNVFCAARKGYTYSWEPPAHLLYHRLRLAPLSGSIQRFNKTQKPIVRLRNTPFLWFRFSLSTIINIGGLIVVTLLLPLQLASNEDPLAFVLSAVGAYYILGIDDYNEPVTYTLVTKSAADRDHVAVTEMALAFRQMKDDDDDADDEEKQAMAERGEAAAVAESLSAAAGVRYSF